MQGKMAEVKDRKGSSRPEFSPERELAFTRQKASFGPKGSSGIGCLKGSKDLWGNPNMRLINQFSGSFPSSSARVDMSNPRNGPGCVITSTSGVDTASPYMPPGNARIGFERLNTMGSPRL